MTEIQISKIIRSKRRTIALQVCPDATVIIRAPFKASDTYINGFVELKRGWITRKQKFFRQQSRSVKEKEFVTGEEFMYLGETYKLYVEPAQSTPRCPTGIRGAPLVSIGAPLLFDSAFHLAQDCQSRAEQEFIKWYKEQARAGITERVNLYSSQTGLRYKQIKISSARKRWGSCSRGGNLNFSWRLIMAPPAVIDYVVAHEVAHLEHKNHSRNFWNKVMALNPDYKQRRRWLREHGHLLEL
ncbi:MAG: SprT family zinc-dependent metalloprotease [Planctomycetota bacterium]